MSERELTLRRSGRVGEPGWFNGVAEQDIQMNDFNDDDVEMIDESSDDEYEAETVIDDESSDDEDEDEDDIPPPPVGPINLIRQNAIGIPPEEHILGKGGKNKKIKHGKDKSNHKTTKKGIKNMKHGGKNKTRKAAPLFKLKSGDLTKYGYHLKGTSRSRHIALGKARKHYPYATMIRKLNALAVLHKNKNASYTKKAKADMNYLRKTRKGHFSKSAGKR